MKITNKTGWTFYISDNYKESNNDKSGKWMYFFETNQLNYVSEICKKAIESNVVLICKHNDEVGCKYSPFGNGQSGVACFYMNYDDIDSHKKVISFFLENNLIKKTKSGRLFNISFKLNSQTREGNYSDTYKSKLTLNQFINLDTGEWIKN